MFLFDRGFVGLRKPHEGFREVFVALWFILVDEAVPEFHEADFTRGAVCKVFQCFFVFDHEPVFGDFVFCFGEFFVWTDFAFASAAVKVSGDGGFEFSSLAKVSGESGRGGVRSDDFGDWDEVYGCWFFDGRGY
jgi:hypothetical protein